MNVPLSKPLKPVPVSRPGEPIYVPRGWRIRRSIKVDMSGDFGGFLKVDPWVESSLRFWNRDQAEWRLRGTDATCYQTREEAESEAFFLATQCMDSIIDIVEW